MVANWTFAFAVLEYEISNTLKDTYAAERELGTDCLGRAGDLVGGHSRRRRERQRRCGGAPRKDIWFAVEADPQLEGVCPSGSQCARGRDFRDQEGVQETSWKRSAGPSCKFAPLLFVMTFMYICHFGAISHMLFFVNQLGYCLFHI